MHDVVVMAVSAAVAAATIIFNSTSQMFLPFINLLPYLLETTICYVYFQTRPLPTGRERGGFGGLRLRLLLHHRVQRQLLDLGVLQELLLTVACGVGGALRSEDHMQAGNVLGHGELVG